jgi:hypothetical protein
MHKINNFKIDGFIVPMAASSMAHKSVLVFQNILCVISVQFSIVMEIFFFGLAHI